MYLEIKKLKVFSINKNTLLKFVGLICCLFIFIFITKYIGFNLVFNGIIYVFVYGILLVGLKLVDIKTETVVT